MTVVSVILLTVSVVCALAFIYPYAGYPIALRVMDSKPLKVVAPRRQSGAEFAILFCAHNESKVIEEKIENLAALRIRYPQVELLAYDDKSIDGTADALEGAGLGVRVVRSAERTGKAHGMKTLVGQTDRPYLIFTDANVTVDLAALDELTALYADSTVGGVCGTLHYVGSDGTPTEKVGGLYWRLEESVKTQESRTGSVMGADGSIFSIRRSLYPDFPDSVQDDFTVSMAAVFAGARLVKSDNVIAFERLVASRSLEWRRKIRIAVRAFHTYLVMAGDVKRMTLRDRYCFYSHKWMRWHGGFFLAAALVFGLAGAFALSWLAGAGLALASLVCVVAAIAVKSGPVATVAEIVISVTATAIGVIRARAGQTMSVWNPPR